MQLSSDPATRLAQLQAIKQYVITNHNAVFDQDTANAMNVQQSPDFWVFKTSVNTDTVNDVVDWGEVLTGSPLSVGERWAFDRILQNGDINPSLTNIRDGLAAIFNSQPNTRNAILLVSTRLATIGESVLASDATGTPAGGDGSTQGSCAVMGDGAEGDVTVDNLIEADGVTL